MHTAKIAVPANTAGAVVRTMAVARASWAPHGAAAGGRCSIDDRDARCHLKPRRQDVATVEGRHCNAKRGVKKQYNSGGGVLVID